MNRSGYNQNRMQRSAYRNPGCGARAERMTENGCGVCGERAGRMPEHTHAACGARTERMQESGCGSARTEQMQNSGCSGARTERMQNSGCSGARTEQMQNSGCSDARTERMQDSGCGVCGARMERASEPARMTCDCTCRIDLPTDRCKLLAMIDEVSFGAYEALLYLDTHPQDEEAMRYFCEHNEKRNKALREYTKLYGPLNLMMPGSNKDCWEWMSQPWPWEGGDR